MIKLKGKIIREEECPLKKSIPCEECEFHDGWGIDLIEHSVDIFCSNPNILDGTRLSLTPISYEEGEKHKK